MDVVKLLLDLANKITKEQISEDKAISEIHTQRIKNGLDEKSVAEIITRSESIGTQSPHLAYNLAYLGYEAAKIIKNRPLEGYSAFTLAYLSIKLARYSRAIKLYQEALSIFEKLNNKEIIGATLGNMGNVYYSLGQYQKAIDHYKEALKIALETGDKNSEGIWLGNMGNVYYSLGQHQKAINYYKEALKIARETRNRRNEGNWLSNLGNICCSLGQFHEAADYFGQALKIVQEIGGKEGDGDWLGNLYIAYSSLGQYQQTNTVPFQEKNEITQKMIVLKEKEAYFKMEKELILNNNYRGKFVAILNGGVIGVSENKIDLALRIYKEKGYIPMYIGKVGAKERVVRVPSPKIQKR